MSENKYIIDKDSLTGIADAVRNKLGAGEATTDPQTGDIVYPEGKGYYLDSVTTTFIEVPDNNAYSISSGSHIEEFIRCTKSDYLTKVEKPVSEIEVEGIFGASVTGRRFKRYIVINSNSFQLDDLNLTNIQNFKQTFDTPQTYLDIYISVTNDYARAQLIRWSNVKIYLRDENGNLIDLITSGFPYNGCTIGTTTSQIQKPIPYSVADIKNNIKDYWSIPDGSLEITENGTYDVTDKASAIVNVPTGGGGGGGGSGIVPSSVWRDSPGDYARYYTFSSSKMADEQAVLNSLINVYWSDKSMLATKSDGSFISYKELGWPNPVTNTIGSLTAAQISQAYDKGHILVMVKNNGEIAQQQNQFYLIVYGTTIYYCYGGGSHAPYWSQIFYRLFN